MCAFYLLVENFLFSLSFVCSDKSIWSMYIFFIYISVSNIDQLGWWHTPWLPLHFTRKKLQQCNVILWCNASSMQWNRKKKSIFFTENMKSWFYTNKSTLNKLAVKKTRQKLCFVYFWNLISFFLARNGGRYILKFLIFLFLDEATHVWPSREHNSFSILIS